MNYFMAIGGYNYEGESSRTARMFFDEEACDAYIKMCLKEAAQRWVIGTCDYFHKVEFDEDGVQVKTTHHVLTSDMID